MKHIIVLFAACTLACSVGCSSSSNTTPTGGNSSDPYILNATGLLFDGAASKVLVPDADDLFLGAGNYTIEAWVKVTPYDYFQWIVVKSTVTPTQDYVFGVNRLNQFTFQGNGAQTIVSDVNTVIEPGRYYHVALVYDRTSMTATIFVDGKPTASGPIVGDPMKVANRLDIGGHNTEGLPKTEGWHGIIYNLSIWNVAKTADQIAQSQYTRPSGTEPGLVAYWQLDEGNGITVFDKTGKHNGTITGSAEWVRMPY